MKAGSIHLDSDNDSSRHDSRLKKRGDGFLSKSDQELLFSLMSKTKRKNFMENSASKIKSSNEGAINVNEFSNSFSLKDLDFSKAMNTFTKENFQLENSGKIYLFIFYLTNLYITFHFLYSFLN